MKFVDETRIRVRSGAGGNGMVSFKAAKNAPKLGADGGDGGFGGHVYLVGNPQLNTLSSLYYKRLYTAEDGVKGGSNGCTGRNGEDCLIQVPLGTVATNLETGEIIAEVLTPEPVRIARGGKRGLGNLRYVSPTHQAPHEFKEGGPSIEFDLGLELKLIADVGFAGFPNAGKSTLLSVISAAEPRIADYPFTTLEPQLGVVDLNDCGDYWDRSFVAADIPGLIKGASLGKGLGHEFLRHLERTKVIVYVIDPYPVTEDDPFQTFETLKRELENFSSGFSLKKSLVVLTKADLKPDDFSINALKAKFLDIGVDVIEMSSVAQTGIKDLKLKVWDLVEKEKDLIREVEESEFKPMSDLSEYQLMVSAPLDEQLQVRL
ncbi:MAG: GTPase ObgE [Pseudobacteriovorax sp.]|nr:GTPase ObgE [Pseudobacteriovorax sp.]